MRRFCFLIALLVAATLEAQVTDDFADGNFSVSPAWSGTSSFGISDAFEIAETDNQLKSQDVNLGSGTRLSYLSTPDVLDLSSATTEWSFRFRLNFAQPGTAGTNANNTSRVYLMSDVADLNGNVDGYYVELRYPSTDVNEVRLYRQDAGTSTELILSGTVQQLTSQTFASVNVSRSELGLWEVVVNSTSQGTVTDNTYNSSSYFGVQVRFTANTRDNGFYFDDFSSTVTPVADTEPPTIQSVTAISDIQVDVRFSEDVTAATAQNTANYVIDGSVTVTNAVQDVDNSLVHLTTSELSNGSTYTLTVNSVEDVSANAIVADSQESFEYLVFEAAEALDVVINEFMPDPNPVVAGLPDAEYVELFNRSSKYFNLENWTLDGNTLPVFTLAPDAYVLIVEDDDIGLFSTYSDVIPIATLSLNNSSADDITLQDDNAIAIHSISYNGSSGGFSTELINPNGPDYSENNYGLSIDPDGGTPGQQNSIFDDTPDTTPPAIASIVVISSTALDITFSEVLEEVSAETINNYSINGGIAVTAAMRDDADKQLVHLIVDPLVSGQVQALTINGVEDLSGNSMVNASFQFEYLDVEEAIAGDVIINEFLSNPVNNTDDFIELYNISDKFIDVAGWTISDESDTSEDLPSFILRPGAYLIIYDEDATVDFSVFGDALAIASLTLNNSDDQIAITSGTDVQVDFLVYEEEQEDGISLELVNPLDPCRLLKNYFPSTHLSGSTPGVQNSVFDDEFFDTTAPVITAVTIVSNTELQVQFDDELDKVSAETVGNYSIDGGISVISATLDGSDNHLVHLVVDPLISEEVRTLTVNGVEDLCGNPVAESIQFEYLELEEAVIGDVIINEFLSNPVDNNNDFIELFNASDKFIDMAGWNISDESTTSEDLPSFILRPGSYLIIYDKDATIDYSIFGDALTIASLTLNNADDQIMITSGTDIEIDFLAYQEEQEDGVSLELINPEVPCRSSLSYRPSVAASGSTPGAENSVFDDTPDIVAPTVQSYNLDFSLTINFSEVMDAASLSAGTYDATGGLTITEALVSSAFPSSVELTFNETIVPGDLYELTISGVADCSGNAMEETTISFGLGRAPTFNELIITELMFDPDPQVELPNREFVEIYNATTDIISTEGLHFTDASVTVEIPSHQLNPAEYYVLTTTSGATEFSGNAIGVPGFPSLNNSGEQLVLSLDGILIFSLTYDPSWHEEKKVDGGYTLEMKDVTNPCLENSHNWGSTQDVRGGTPGAVNSVLDVIPDSFGPEILTVIAESPDSIRVDFSEKIDPMVLATVSIGLSPAITTREVFFNPIYPSTLTLTLEEDLIESMLYTLTIKNVTDCLGNQNQEETVTFALPVVSEGEEIKLSEILFNPRSNGVDFVEVYNTSKKYLSLKNWKLATLDGAGEVDEEIITTQELVLAPNQYMVFTTNTDVLLNNYPKGQSINFFGMPSLPSYPNDEGTVILMNALNEVKESFDYSENYHYNLLESVDGVSLERVSYEESTNNGDNWRSASSTEGFATPGYANSQSLVNDTPVGRVTASPEVFIPGNSGSGRDFTTINYSFDQPGKFANITIYDQWGRLVKNLAQGTLLSTSGFLRWDGDTNEGKIARMGYHLIIFEIYDSSGNSEIIKETVVVGRDF